MSRLFPSYLATAIALSTAIISLSNQPISAYFLTYAFVFLILYAIFRPSLSSNYPLYGLALGATLIIALITIQYIP